MVERLVANERVGGSIPLSRSSSFKNLTINSGLCKIYVSAMKKFLLSAAFFTITPMVLFASLIFLSLITYQNGGALLSHAPNSVAFAALPSNDTLIEGQINSEDARVENLRAFFERHNSPLEPYSDKFVETAAEYDLDFRLLPAIAMQESNLCKKAPKDSFNCWGFGIYGSKITKFSDFNEAIESVSKTLSQNYKSVGLVTPEQIMTKYTPSSNGSWANSVNFFMGQLQ